MEEDEKAQSLSAPDSESKSVERSETREIESRDPELKRIEAFDLVTEGLQLLDRYQERKEWHLISEAFSCFKNAVKVDPEYIKARYFLALTNYLSVSGRFGPELSSEVSRELLGSETEGSEFADWSPIKQFQEIASHARISPNSNAYAEASYNLGTVYYEMWRNYGSDEIQSAEPNDREVSTTWPDYVAISAIQSFTRARFLTREPGLQLLGITGELAVRARRMNKEDREMVNELSDKIKAELRGNFWRRLFGLKSADRQVTAKVSEILKRIPKMGNSQSNETPSQMASAT